jgi:hypothetical protein
MPRGGVVGCISSIAGEGWQLKVADLNEVVDDLDFDAATLWFDQHRGDDDRTCCRSRQ